MISRQNNFDLIRLLAALQVMVIHSIEHLCNGSLAEFPASVLSFFPGVPIFFFMSGFLICGSWEQNPDWRKYASNRILRIYPALWFCLALTVGLALLLQGPGFLGTLAFGVWLLAQATCAQFYNLEAFRGLGVGTINGSLWTISIELQFYLLLPIILVATTARDNKRYLWGLWFIALLFRECFIWFRMSYFDVMPMKLIGATLLPYFAIFCTGMLCQLHWETIRRFFEGQLWLWLVAYGVWVSIGVLMGFATCGNVMSSLFYIPLCGLVLAIAFSYGEVSKKLLCGCDVSYGLYLYHMLAINFVLESQIEKPLTRVLIATALSVAFAMFSWTMVEKPCMKWKQSFGLVRKQNHGPTIQKA